MISALLSRSVVLVFGTLYPAYASFKAVKSKNIKEYVKWMTYWIVFALFTVAEAITDTFFSWFPFYYEAKILFIIWLLSPLTRGSSLLYRRYVHPQLSKREETIDAYVSSASEQGYMAVIDIGSKGLYMATDLVIKAALKHTQSESVIGEKMKKSYSTGDVNRRKPIEFEVTDDPSKEVSDVLPDLLPMVQSCNDMQPSEEITEKTETIEEKPNPTEVVDDVGKFNIMQKFANFCLELGSDLKKETSKEEKENANLAVVQKKEKKFPFWQTGD